MRSVCIFPLHNFASLAIETENFRARCRAWLMLELSLESILTVIVTTSPSPVHPSLELIDALLHSISTYAPELVRCRFVLVCDGFKPAAKNAFRSGKVDATAVAAYIKYKDELNKMVNRLRQEFPLGDTASEVSHFPYMEVLEFPENRGFGFAVKDALANVTTPLVCVIQHDRTFLRTVDIPTIARAIIESHGTVGYVLLPTRSTANYVHQQRSRLGTYGVKEASKLHA